MMALSDLLTFSSTSIDRARRIVWMAFISSIGLAGGSSYTLTLSLLALAIPLAVAYQWRVRHESGRTKSSGVE